MDKKNRKSFNIERNLVLIGFMGTGKSAVSGYLHRYYGMKTVEMDEEIERREKRSIPDIFAAYGEEYFRNKETQLIRELQSESRIVISCGGGAALREENVREMKKNGIVVLLTANLETIYERVKNNENRPLLKGNMNTEYIAELMEKRREKYEAAADIVIQTDGKSVAEICEELILKSDKNL